MVLDCEWRGTGKAAAAPAPIEDANVVVRNLKTSGYAVAIRRLRGDKVDVKGPNVDEFCTKPPVSLFEPAAKPLCLLIKETPELAWDRLDDWVAPQKFRAVADDREDDTQTIQADVLACGQNALRESVCSGDQRARRCRRQRPRPSRARSVSEVGSGRLWRPVR